MNADAAFWAVWLYALFVSWGWALTLQRTCRKPRRDRRGRFTKGEAWWIS